MYVLYSAVSSPLDRSKRFTFCSLTQMFIATSTRLIWKHSSHAAITHISTTVCSFFIQLSKLRHCGENENPKLRNISKEDSNTGYLDCESDILPSSTQPDNRKYAQKMVQQLVPLSDTSRRLFSIVTESWPMDQTTLAWRIIYNAIG